MGRKAKYTFELKLKAAQDYLSGKKSAADIAFELDMGKYGDNRIRQWASLYKANGQEALKPKERNSSYSKEFKEWSIVHIFLLLFLLWFLCYSFSSFSSTFLIS